MVISVLALVVGGWLVAARPMSPQVSASDVRLGTELPATAMNRSTGPANNSPTLQADPTDDRFVVLAHRVDAPDYVCSLQLSGDGGNTWWPVNPVPDLPDGADKCFGGEVAFDRHGRLYFLFMGLVGGGNEPMGAFLTTSADRGRTFSPPKQVLGPLNFAVRMALDPTIGNQGRIQLVWLHATSDPAGGFGPPPNPILTAYSDDGGSTFSAPIQVSDPDRQRVVAPTLALGGDHRVHVAYYDLLNDARDYQGLEGPVWDGEWSLMVATSTDAGQTFEPGVVAESAVVPPSRVMAVFIMPPPALAARDELVCVGWADARNGDPDVLARCSHDAGRRWDPPARLNDDEVGTGRWQYLPGLAIAPGGRVDVIFYDRRNDVQNLNNDIFYTFSHDDGRTYAPNIQLNRDGASLSVVGQRYAVPSAEGQFDFGSRMALLSRRHGLIAAWADTRNSFPYVTDQDIFATQIHLPARRGNAVRMIIGSALIVTGLVTLAVVWRRQPRARR